MQRQVHQGLRPVTGAFAEELSAPAVQIRDRPHHGESDPQTALAAIERAAA